MGLLSFLSPPEVSVSEPELHPIKAGDALATDDRTIVVTAREHLDTFKAEFGLKPSDGLPDRYEDIDAKAKGGLYARVDGAKTTGLKDPDDKHRAGLDTVRLKQDILYCCGADPYDPSAFTIWEPDHTAPYIIESRKTPVDWLIYCESSVNDFFERYGVTRCDRCEGSWDGKLLRCPSCGKRPTTVQAEIEDLQETHQGVLVMISPSQAPQGLTEHIKNGLVSFKQYLFHWRNDE